jgi:FG-GAP repeat/FG-GAP-like repeat
MSLKSGKKIGNVTKSTPGWLMARWGTPLVILALMLSGLTAVRATSLLDPRPESSTTHFGLASAVVGDLDGDGVPDLAVGAPFQDGDFDGSIGFGPPQNVGKVFLISGATLGVIAELNDPDFEMVQPIKFGGQLGSSITGVGDINGDGIPDILVGDPHHIVIIPTDHLVAAGRAYVFSGKDHTVLFTLDDPTAQEGARMGFAVAGLGDVNGDGVNDMVVGVPKKDSAGGLPIVGTAYIFSGKDGTLIRSLDPPSQGGLEANGRFGAAVANAGDVNHDGVDDIIIGAPGQSRAYVFSGATGALIFTITSPVVERQLPSFGFAVAGGKDLNGDGIPDFAIGAPLVNSFKGAAYIFNGSDGTLQRKLKSPAPQAFAKFGASIALSPDVTGDRRPDILVGAPDHTVNGLLNAGEAFIFNGANGKIFKTLTSAVPTAVAGFGYAITNGDFNGDGIPETVVGAPLEDANIIDDMGDLVTHLQIGQIEIQ